MNTPTWRTSSHSSGNGACVQLAGTRTLLRDSKNPHGPVLQADAAALITWLKH